MTSTSGAAVTLSSLGRKLEPKPDNDTQRKVSKDKLEKTHQGSFLLPPDLQMVVICLNKSSYSYWKLAACPNHCSFPHFRQAVLFISILQSNKSHIISISLPIPCSNSFSNWTELSQHRSDTTQLERWQHVLKLHKSCHTERLTQNSSTYFALCFTWHIL